MITWLITLGQPSLGLGCSPCVQKMQPSAARYFTQALLLAFGRPCPAQSQVGTTDSVCHHGSALSVTRAECIWRAGLGKGSVKCPSVSVHSFSWPHYISIAFVRVSGGDRCPSCRKGNLVTPWVFPSHSHCVLRCLAAFPFLFLPHPPSPHPLSSLPPSLPLGGEHCPLAGGHQSAPTQFSALSWIPTISGVCIPFPLF